MGLAEKFRPKGSDDPGGGNAWMDFTGEQRRYDTHASATDPEAKLVIRSPGKEARLRFAGDATMENRNSLCMLFEVQRAVGAPESAVDVDQMIELRNRGFAPKTVGADKGNRTAEFITGLREQKIVPHRPRIEYSVGHRNGNQYDCNVQMTSAVADATAPVTLPRRTANASTLDDQPRQRQRPAAFKVKFARVRAHIIPSITFHLRAV